MPANTRPIPALRPPALLLKWPVLLTAVLLLSIPFFIPIPFSLRYHPLFSFMGDQLHIPMFACITLLLYWVGPLTGRLRMAAVAAAVLGGLVEVVQLTVGRSALIQDWVLDLVGIGFAVGLVLWKGQRSRWGLPLILVLLLAQPIQLRHLPGLILGTYQAHDMFPVISDFEGGHILRLWSTNGTAELEFGQTLGSPTDNGTTVMRLTGGPPSHWPGMEMRKFPPDWSGYSELVFDIRLATPGLEKAWVHVRLDDYDGRRDDLWAKKDFNAKPAWRTIVWPLENLDVVNHKRLFNLTQVDRIMFFLGHPDGETVLEIDNIHLR